MDAAMEGLAGLDDHDLLAGGVADGVAEARAGARRWARLVAFHRRREAQAHACGAVARQAALTPRAETVTEVSALWGLAEQRVRHELNVALFLEQYFPDAWALCQAGQLDCYRATVVADHVRHAVADPVLIRTLAARLTDFLPTHLSAAHGVPGVPPIVGCTPKQLRNKLSYEIKRLRSTDAEERHRQAYADRSVRATELEDGMAHLGITATVDQVRLAEHRLTHAPTLTPPGTGCSPTRPARWWSCRRPRTAPPPRSGGMSPPSGSPASSPPATPRPPRSSSTTGPPGRRGRPGPATCGRPASAGTPPSTRPARAR